MRPIIFLLAIRLFAGQSLDLTTQNASNSSFTPYAISASFTVDFAFAYKDTNIASGGIIHPFVADFVGLDAQIIHLSSTNILLQLTNVNEFGGANCQMQIATLTLNHVNARFIHNVVTGIDTCQLNDLTGVQQNIPYNATSVSGANSNHLVIGGGGGGEDIDWDYIRIYNYAIASSARLPTTADFTTGIAGACSASAANAFVYWNFDLCNNTGSLSDISGNNMDAVMSSGSPTYVNSVGQAPPYSPKGIVVSDRISTLPANHLWLQNYPAVGITFDTTPNHTNTLDCSNSYSQADLSNLVTCGWSAATGPTTPVFTGTNIVTVTNLADTRAAGQVDYTMQLSVTDTASNTSTSTQHIGALPMDRNGVVQNGGLSFGSAIDKEIGPMIAFGQNPYGYEEEREYYMSVAQVATPGSNIAGYVASATWATPATGTVSYTFEGRYCTIAQSLAADITSSATTIHVNNAAACLSMASFPTWIYLINFGSNQMETVRLSGCHVHGTGTACTDGVTTDADLLVAYDGRGIADGQSFSGPSNIGASSWTAAATQLGSYRVQGTSTLFSTDSTRPICPAGAPGPPGAVTYSTGSVQLTPSSAAVAGIGTNWSVGNGVIAGYDIRVSATHASGTPFTWWAKITLVGGIASITASRPAPSDVDAATNFSYAITGIRYISLNFAISGTTTRALQNAFGCESDTVAFAFYAHDLTAIDSTVFSGQQFSFKDGLGATSAVGPNFYGSGLAERKFHLRSGLTAPKTAADSIDELWINDPELCNLYCYGSEPLLIGGGVIGAFADLVTNPTTTLTWPKLRQAAVFGSIGGAGCNAGDTRDSGIDQGFVAQAALFDPDPTFHTQWQTALAALYVRDTTTVNAITGSTGCKGADNSWANGGQWAAQFPAMDLTQHSAVAIAHFSGTFSAGMCNAAVSGTASVSGSALTALTGTFQAGSQIVLTTTTGTITTFRTAFVLNSGSSITLGGIYPFTAGVATVNWIITTNDNDGYLVSTIAANNDDPLLQQNWNCTYNNTSQITLHTPWTSATDTTGNLHLAKYNLAGYGQQTFMLAGYKSLALNWGAQNSDPTLAAGNAVLANLAAAWVHDNGYDPQSMTMNYGNVYAGCLPATVASTADTVWRINDCATGADLSAIRGAAVLNGESMTAVRYYYLANAGTTARTYGDNVYAAVWGRPDWTIPGYPTNSNYVRDENGNVSLASFKWPGFFFGVGAAQQWPAIRLISSLSPVSVFGGKQIFGGGILVH